MADDSGAVTLTPEQQTHVDGLLTKARETAVTEFKTSTEEARKKAIPEKYDFKFADNTPLDPKGDAEKIAAFARKHAFSTEQATELLKHQEELAGGLVARQQQTLQTQIETWNSEIKADKELGGEHFTATLANVKRVIDRFGAASPDFGKLVESSGYGSHPAFVKIFNAIGKAMSEDKTILSGTGGGPAAEKPAPGKRMFPTAT